MEGPSDETVARARAGELTEAELDVSELGDPRWIAGEPPGERRHELRVGVGHRGQVPVGYLDGRLGLAGQEQAVHPEPIGRHRHRRRDSVESGLAELDQRGLRVAAHLGDHGGHTSGGEADDRVVIAARH